MHNYGKGLNRGKTQEFRPSIHTAHIVACNMRLYNTRTHSRLVENIDQNAAGILVYRLIVGRTGKQLTGIAVADGNFAGLLNRLAIDRT